MGENCIILVSSSARERIGVLHNGASCIMLGEIKEDRVTKEDADDSGGKMREGVTIGIAGSLVRRLINTLSRCGRRRIRLRPENSRDFYHIV